MSYLPEGVDVRITKGADVYYFKINRSNYRVSDLSAFTPQMGSGGVERSDLDHQSAIEQPSFHGGAGQPTMVDNTAYRTAHNVDARHSGVVSLFSKIFSTTVPGITGRIVMAADEDYLFIGGTGGVVVWDGSNFLDISAGLANTNVIGMFHNGESLFVGLDNHRIHRLKTYVFSTYGSEVWEWEEVGVTYASTGTDDFSARAFAIYDGKHWHSQDGTNLVHWWWRGDGADAETGISLSLLDGSYNHPAQGVDYDPTAVEVGTMAYPVKWLEPYDAWLYAFKQDGIYRIAPNGAGGYYTEVVMDMSKHTRMGENYAAVAYENAALWLGHKNRFERLVGKSTTNVTPRPLVEDFPPVVHDRLQAVFPVYDGLYALLSGNLYHLEGTGASPHILHGELLGDESAGTVRDIGAYPAFMEYYTGHFHKPAVVLAVFDGTETTLYYWHVENEYSNAPLADEGFIQTSAFSNGFSDVPKYWHSVKVEFNIPTEGGEIHVEAASYEDGEVTIYDMGTVTNQDATPSVEGRWNKGYKTFYFPKDARGKWIDFKFTLTRAPDTDARSPLLYAYVLEFVLRPPTIYGYAPMFLLSDKGAYAGGWQDTFNVVEGIAALEDIRDSVTPVYYEDYFGHRAWVYMATIVERDVQTYPEDYFDSDVAVQSSFVLIQKDCGAVVVDEDEALIVEGYYEVDCSLTIEEGGSLTVQ